MADTVKSTADPTKHGFVVLRPDGSDVGMAFGLAPFDYIAATYPNATTEVYTYKTGGSGGTTVGTITVVYTDSTKEFISTVTKT